MQSAKFFSFENVRLTQENILDILHVIISTMVLMITLRISKIFSWIRRTFSEENNLADCISGQFKKPQILGILNILAHKK